MRHWSLRQAPAPRPVQMTQTLTFSVPSNMVSYFNPHVYDVTKLRSDVSYAAAVLDEHKPGWYENITRPLNLDSYHDCVLGQVFGIESRNNDPHSLMTESGFGIGRMFLDRRKVKIGPGVFAASEAKPMWEEEIALRRNAKPIEVPEVEEAFALSG